MMWPPLRVAMFATFVLLGLAQLVTCTEPPPLYLHYRPAHSPPPIPVWASILILHCLAAAIAFGWYLLYLKVVRNRKAREEAKKPDDALKRQYSVKRKRASTNSKSPAKQKDTESSPKTNDKPAGKQE